MSRGVRGVDDGETLRSQGHLLFFNYILTFRHLSVNVERDLCVDEVEIIYWFETGEE